MMRHFAIIYPERIVPSDAWVLRPVAAIGFATFVGCESDISIRAHLTGLVLGVRIATGCGFETAASVLVDPKMETQPDEFRNTEFIVPKPSRVVVALGGCDMGDVLGFGRFVPAIVENIGGEIQIAEKHLLITALPSIDDYGALYHACSELVPSAVIVTRAVSIDRPKDNGFEEAMERWVNAAQRLETAVCVVEAFDSTVFDKIFTARGLMRSESCEG
jgi:hypothetical protein